MGALEQLSDWPVDAVAAAVVRDGEVAATYGDGDQVFELASVTKLLVAYAVLVAIEEEALALDDVAPIDPEVTVAHLLAHASGLDFAERKLVARPATQRIYSSAGFELLAEMVERATDIAFPEYLRAAVLEPLGMSGTELWGPAGHGARSSVADLTRFLAELDRPRLLHESTLAAAFTVQFPGLAGFVPGYGKHADNTWGLGFEIRGNKTPHWTGGNQSPTAVGHFGQAGTFLWFDPTRRLGAVVLTDRPFGAWAKPLWRDFNDALIAQFG